jgi:hypothetical protein
MFLAILAAIGAGALSALLYASASVGTLGALILVLLAQLPLFMVGLSRGQGERAAALAGAVGLLGIDLTEGLWASVNFALAEAAPAFLVVRQALLRRSRPDGSVEWYPAGRLLTWLSLYASAILLAFTLYFMGREGGLEGELQRTFSAMWESLGETMPPEAARMLGMLVDIMPGLGGASWLLITVCNAALAQGLLVRAGRNLRPSPSLRSFALPGWLAGAVTVTAVAGTLLPGTPGFAGRNLGLVLAMPYFFGGVALVHGLARRAGAQRGLLIMLYAVLAVVILILSWLAILAIAALGLIDQVAGLNRRLERPKGGPNGNLE